MFNVWFWQKYSARPLHIFAALGIASIGIGFILGLILIGLRILGRISLVNSSLPMFAMLMIICGVIFFCFGLVSDMLMKIYYSVEHKRPYTIRKVYK